MTAIIRDAAGDVLATKADLRETARDLGPPWTGMRLPVY